MIICIFATDMKKILKVDNPNDHTLSQLSYPSFCHSIFGIPNSFSSSNREEKITYLERRWMCELYDVRLARVTT